MKVCDRCNKKEKKVEATKEIDFTPREKDIPKEIAHLCQDCYFRWYEQVFDMRGEILGNE